MGWAIFLTSWGPRSAKTKQLGAYMVLHSPGDANATGLRKSLQSGRDINGIAEEVVALHHDVADLDADTELHLLIGKAIGVLLGDSILRRDRALHGIDGAGEISDETVTRRVEDSASMRGDQPIDDDPVSRKGAKGADLISAHQAAVALHIGCEDRGELSFDGWGFQSRHLPNPEYIPTSCEIRGVLGHSEACWCAISDSDGVSVVSTRPACTGAAEDLRRKRRTRLNSPIETIQNSGMRPLKAGLIYFLLVFALGWVLGPIRELWAVPQFGRITALLLEAVIMLIAMVVSSRWVMRRFNVPQTLGSTIPMGLVALAILAPAEIAGVLWVRGLSLREYLASFVTAPGVISLVMFCCLRRCQPSSCFHALTS